MIVAKGSAVPEIPGKCPCCGGYSLTPPEGAIILLAVCDVLVFKALETLGRYVVRVERSRWKALGDRPRHIAHTLWPPTDEMVTKALRGAWDVVPALLDVHAPRGGPRTLDPSEVGVVLDGYVHDLAITGQQHTVSMLSERLSLHLHLPLGDCPHEHEPSLVPASATRPTLD